MRTPEKASDLGAFAFPRNTKPRRYGYGGTTTFHFGGLPPWPAERRRGECDRLRLHAHRWTYQYAADPRLRTTEAIRGVVILRRGDPGLRAGGGSCLRGCERTFRRSSETDPPVGQFPFLLGRAVRERGVPGGHPRARRPGLACGSVRGDGHVPDGRGIRERRCQTLVDQPSPARCKTLLSGISLGVPTWYPRASKRLALDTEGRGSSELRTFLLPLFTGVRGIRILGSSAQPRPYAS